MIVVHCGFQSQLHTLGYSQSTLGKKKQILTYTETQLMISVINYD